MQFKFSNPNHPLPDDDFLASSTGDIPYGMTNDYMFRAVLQMSNNALRHLISALINIPVSSITDCQILNPIILGESIDEKSCIMDIRLELNHERLVNIEMQTSTLDHWPNRALFYLSKLYCNIKRGEDYSKIKPALHIGILTGSPFEDIHEFYSEYYMINPSNQHIFSRFFSARVLDLSQINNVTDAQRETELYFWARLFVVTTWEEINMLTKDHDFLKSAASHLRTLTEDEKIQQQCEARERYYMDMSNSKSAGIEQGIKAGTNYTNQLNQYLIHDNRMDDLIRAASDSEFQQLLFREYNIL